MIRFTGRPLLIAIATFVAGCNASFLAAKDYFLTIGGGNEPSNNQLSLERNVIFQQSILAEQRPDHPDFEIWFADGNEKHRDVQCRDPEFERTCPPGRRLMAELFGDADSADLVYRNNEIKGLAGPANLKVVKDRLGSLASEVKSGDRVIVYATGHGGQPKRERGRRRGGGNPYNTVLYFWNSETLSAREMTDLLDRFPSDVQVVLIMVQCYAGGFSHTIFQHADEKAGLSPHQRCGFFAQMHDRAAAGCTPDADEADFEEYSGCFWSALAGKSRDGKTISTADYDKNGRVSFAEAHAYAIIESDTIDVPVRTSEAFLRTYSGVGTNEGGSADRSSAAGAAANGDIPDANSGELATMSGPISKLLPSCRPDHRAILEQLSRRCELGSEPTIEAITQKIEQKKQTLDELDNKLTAATRARRGELRKLKEEMYTQWPELKSTYAPLAFKLADDHGPEFVAAVKAMANFGSWREAMAKEKEASKAVLRAERESARLERLERACENAVLAQNLSRIAKPEIVNRYQQLVAMEEETLTNPGDAGAISK